MISLTFDDGLHQHLDHAVPILDEHRLTGTFYVHLANEPFLTRIDEWKDAARRHELGNHSVFHPADAGKLWVRPGNAINHYSLDRMELELSFANDWLTALDGHKDRTYAFPCSNMTLGDWGACCKFLFRIGLRNTRWPGLIERLRLDLGNSRRDFRPLAKKLFVAARTGGLYLSDCSPPVQSLRLDALPSAAIEGHSFQTIRGFVERSLQSGGWPILQFHGVGGGHRMDCDVQTFRELVAWLACEHSEKVVTILRGAQSPMLNGNVEVGFQ